MKTFFSFLLLFFIINNIYSQSDEWITYYPQNSTINIETYGDSIITNTWSAGLLIYNNNGELLDDITNRDGLNELYDTKFDIDSNGSIWILTNKFSYNIYKFENGELQFECNLNYFFHIWNIFIDSQDSLWICSDDGLYKYRNQNLIKMSDNDSVINQNFIAMTQDLDGNYWLLSIDNIYKFNGDVWIKYEHSFSGGFLNSIIYCDNNNKIWSAGDNLICIDNGNINQFEYGTQIPNLLDTRSICQDSSRNIIFTTTRNIIRFDGLIWDTLVNNEDVFNNNSENFYSCKLGNDNLIKLASSKGLYNLTNSIFNPCEITSLHGMGVNDIEFDINNGVWLSIGNGVEYFNDNIWYNKYYDSFIHFDIEKIDSNTFLVGGSSISVFKDTAWKCNIENQPPYSFKSIEKDTNNNLWFAGNNGLYSFIDSVWNFEYSNNIVDFVIDKNNNKWIGTYNGLIKISNSDTIRYTTSDGLPNNNINALFVDSNNNIWIGTNKGASVYNGVLFKNYSDNIQFPSWVYYISENNLGQILLATVNGVAVIDNDSIFYITNSIENWFYSVKEDRFGNIWIGSRTKGIFIYKEGGVNLSYVYGISGDINGNGIIDNNEILGDSNGNGILDNNEVIGDLNGDGFINFNETIISNISNNIQIKPYTLKIKKNTIEVFINNSQNISTYKIINTQGYIIEYATLNNNSSIINLSNLKHGVYYIELLINNKKYYEKIIVTPSR